MNPQSVFVIKPKVVFHLFSFFALLVSLLGNAAAVTPVYAEPPAPAGLPAGLSAADWAQIQALFTPSQQAYLKASNTNGLDNFGTSVAISGDTVVIGASGEGSNTTGINGNQADNSLLYAGAVYVFVRSNGTWTQQAYIKASNTGDLDTFGRSVAIAGDTIVVGADSEDSNATGVNGNQSDDSATDSGAAYVFTRSGSIWSQQAYLKASNTQNGDRFGSSVSIFGDTIVVGAYAEDSNSTGVNGNQADNSVNNSGAAYVFTRSGNTWSQQSYLKASNTGEDDWFGRKVTISGDTIVVGAINEDSSATGVNGNQADNFASNSGAAYVFTRNGSAWSQQAYLKASNTESSDNFGIAVAVLGDTLVVGASGEKSSATGVNGNQADNSANAAGAAYVFTRNGSVWSQQAYLKASNTAAFDIFGSSVAISGDTIVVGAAFEDSSATGVNGNQADNSASIAGAAYVFARSSSTWSQQAYLKASNTGADDEFGGVAISGDTIVVGAEDEKSNATGVNGNQEDNSENAAGAAYVFSGFGPILNNSVQDIAVLGDDVYVGGSFTNAAGIPDADHIVKWNGSNWSALGNTPLNLPVYDLHVVGTDLYVGGPFTNAGGNANADYIAKWNGSAWSSLGTTPLDADVNSITGSGSSIYIGGNFTNAGGNANADYVAKWNGTALSAVNSTPLNNIVISLAVLGKDLYVGGFFDNAGGVSNADYIARLDGNTNVWNAVGSGTLGGPPLGNGLPFVIVSDGTNIYVGGDFIDAGAIATADYLAKWNGSAWSAVGTPTLNGAVWDILVNWSTVYVAGEFTNAGSDVNADHLAKWNGASWASVNSTPLNTSAGALALDGTSLYVGGLFTDVGGNAYADYMQEFTVDAAQPTILRAILPSNGAQDGWVRESTETSETGGTVDSTASVLIVGDDVSDRQYRSILSFDTSSLPDNAVITQATLAIRVNAIQGGGNPLTMFNYYMADVISGSFGAPALAASDFQANPTVTAGPLGQTNTGGGWLYIGLKTGLTGINPTGLTQLRLRYSLGDNDNGIENILKFYSGNYTTVNHRPQLNVWYFLP